MTPRQLLGIALLAFSVFLLALAGLLLLEARHTAPPGPEVADEDEAPPEEAEAPPAPARRPRSWSEGARTVIPRPEGLPPAASTGAPFDEDTVRAALSEANPGVRACVVQWAALDPDLGGGVDVELVLALGGLVRAELLDHLTPPPAPVVCLGEALWGVAWPWPEDALERTVRYRFQFYDAETIGHITGLAVGEDEEEDEAEDAEAGDSAP